MFKLIQQSHENEIISFCKRVATAEIADIVSDLSDIIKHIHADIPDKKRISYGRYSIITELGIFIYPLLPKKKEQINKIATDLFKNNEYDPFIRSLGMHLLSLQSETTGNLATTLSLFEKAAMDDHWIVRECSAGFIRKLIKQYPEILQPWYLTMVHSTNALQRRFAIESLRPVADNSWLRKYPDFPFSVLEQLYTEPEEYPRTSVGNSLSDWMRIDEPRTIEIVKKLVITGNKHSYWIAYRACRNLVKKRSLLVMNILNIDCYKYKDRIFHRDHGSIT